MVKLSDVAKEAGVSQTTVSFILNGKASEMRISKETIAKVNEAINRLGYYPNVSAKRLPKYGAQEELVPEIVFEWSVGLHPSFLTAFIGSFQKALSDGRIKKMNLSISSSSIESMENNPDRLLHYSYNGAIFSPMADTEKTFIKSVSDRIPTVVLHIPTPDFNSVVVDHYRAGQMAAEVFHKRGLYNVTAIFSENLGHTSVKDQRAEGFRNYCSENNLNFNTLMIPSKQTFTTDQRAAFGKEKALELIQNRNLSQGIFIYDDVTAVAFATTLYINGISIPDDIEIITYGNELLAGTISPSITTIDYPSDKVAEEAIHLLSEQFSSPNSELKHIKVSPGVTFRESCPKPKDL